MPRWTVRVGGLLQGTYEGATEEEMLEEFAKDQEHSAFWIDFGTLAHGPRRNFTSFQEWLEKNNFNKGGGERATRADIKLQLVGQTDIKALDNPHLRDVSLDED